MHYSIDVKSQYRYLSRIDNVSIVYTHSHYRDGENYTHQSYSLGIRAPSKSSLGGSKLCHADHNPLLVLLYHLHNRILKIYAVKLSLAKIFHTEKTTLLLVEFYLGLQQQKDLFHPHLIWQCQASI